MNDTPTNHNMQTEGLLEQLVDEFTRRVRSGDRPSVAEYVEQHPQVADELQELLSSVAMIEGLKMQTGSLPGGTRSPFEDLADLKQLGEYRIVSELGRGGMGIVLKAIHESLGRQVAIKVLPNQLVSDQRNIERFQREAAAAATLHHSNIVSVFGVGHSDGYHYYVMEYINGQSLDKIIQRFSAREFQDQDQPSENDPKMEPASASIPKGVERFRWAAGLIRDIADALEYAHTQGVLHRDIKPANLLLDPSGRIWLTDFGLARNLTNHTMTREIIGTPQYMAPESFEARYEISSETYCLGATLHEMVTRQPLHHGSTAAEIIRKVTSEQPISPRKLDNRIPFDLSTIIEKSTATDPAARYATAREFRDDLDAFLDGRPIAAKRVSVARRTWMWSKRNPWQAISISLAVLLAAFATAGFVQRSRTLETVSRQKEVVSKQNNQLRIEKERTLLAQKAAEENLRQYRQQYKRAEANVQISLELYDAMFRQLVAKTPTVNGNFSFDNFQELCGIETTISPQDAQFLEGMLEFFQRFAQANADNTELVAQAARSYRRVANIYHLLGQTDSATTAYHESIQLYNRLNEDRPSVENGLLRSRTANELGLLKSGNGDFRGAISIFQRVLKQLQQHPNASSVMLRIEQVKTLNLMGTASPLESTEALISDRISERRELGPGGRRSRRNYRDAGRVRRLGTRNVEFVEKAIQLVNQLIDECPDDADLLPELLLERARSHLRLAELQFILKQTSASLVSKRQAVEDLSRLNAEFPESSYRTVLAEAYAMPIGQDDQAAVQELNLAREILRDLRKQSPGNSRYQQLNADIHFQLAQIALDQEKHDVAVREMKVSAAELADVLDRVSGNPVIAERFFHATRALVETLIVVEDYRTARDVLQKSIERSDTWKTNRRGRTGQPVAGKLRQWNLYSMLAKCHNALGDRGKARAAQQKARELRQQFSPSGGNERARPNGRANVRSKGQGKSRNRRDK